MAKPAKTGITRIVNAAGYSWQGIRYAYKNEAAFRQEIWLAAVLVPLAYLLAGSAMQAVALIATVLLVLMAELINSAIEAVVDRIGDEPHPLSGAAKDMGSAVVLLAIALLVMVWFSVLVFA